MPSTRAFITTMVSRPIRFFFTEPICCTVSIMSATVFGSVYLQTEGIKVIYQSFGFDEKRAALPLTSWIIGLLLTVPLRIFDWSLVSRRLRLGYSIRPEDKLTGFYVAAPVLAVSLWWLSWTIPPYVRLPDRTSPSPSSPNTQTTGPKHLPPRLNRRPNTNRRLYQRIRRHPARLPDRLLHRLRRLSQRPSSFSSWNSERCIPDVRRADVYGFGQ
jgi:hypothetical protein